MPIGNGGFFPQTDDMDSKKILAQSCTYFYLKVVLGEYTTEERAIEVLDDMQQHIETTDYLKVRPEAWHGESFVYDMPQE